MIMHLTAAQLADPAVPTDVWEQDQPQSGASETGHQPATALAVVTAGINATREVPTLESATGAILVSQGLYQRVVGRVPQRRKIHITTNGAAVQLCDSDGQAMTGQGLNLPVGTILTLTTASEIWARNSAGADATVSFWQEIDLG